MWPISEGFAVKGDEGNGAVTGGDVGLRDFFKVREITACLRMNRMTQGRGKKWMI